MILAQKSGRNLRLKIPSGQFLHQTDIELRRAESRRIAAGTLHQLLMGHALQHAAPAPPAGGGGRDQPVARPLARDRTGRASAAWRRPRATAQPRSPALVIHAVRIRVVPVELRKVLWRQLFARAQRVRLPVPVPCPPCVVAARPGRHARPGVQQQLGHARAAVGRGQHGERRHMPARSPCSRSGTAPPARPWNAR